MLSEIREFDAAIPVVISTHADDPGSIVELVKHGAFDYVVEPEDWADEAALLAYVDRMSLALGKAMQWRAMFEENRRLKRDLAAKDLSSEIIARSEPMLGVLDLVRKVAPTTATVIISGAMSVSSGT